jgi:dTDP-4-amino-4,6-dideoxygalactose transaminase
VKVPLLDLKPQYRSLKNELDAAILRVSESQYFILGPEVKALEAATAAYCGCKFGIGISSGTDALLIALMALDIGAGDEVITSPYTFFATAGTIARVGARPVFVDIDADTFNISPAAIEQFIATECQSRDGALINRTSGARVRALMPVHLYGQVADMARIMEIAARHRLAVIEDAAQAIGSEDAAGRRACSMGDIGCLSFFPTKNLGAFGDAGMCVTNDAALAAKLMKLRVHGMEPKYYHELIGGNFRLDEIQAAVLNVKLPHLDSWSAARARNAAFYDAAFKRAGLGDAISTPPPAPAGARHIYNQYCIRARRRDELRKHLAAHDVGAEIYYPLPLHMQQCFAYLGHQPDDFPVSLRAAHETLALPIYPELAESQLQYVVDTISHLFRQ